MELIKIWNQYEPKTIIIVIFALSPNCIFSCCSSLLQMSLSAHIANQPQGSCGFTSIKPPAATDRRGDPRFTKAPRQRRYCWDEIVP